MRVLLTSEVLDLATARVDVALRVGPARGASLVARRVGELAAGFFAAPSYVERRGRPRSLAELSAHDGLWPLTAPERAFRVRARPPPPAVGCADFGFLLEAARAGAGVALLPTVLAARDVATGSLVRVLPDVTLREAPVHVVTMAPRTLPPRTAALRAHLLAALPLALR